MALDFRGATTAFEGISSFRLDVGRLTLGVRRFAAIAARSTGRIPVGPAGGTPVLLRRQNIDFDESVAGSVILAGHDGSGVAGGPHDDDG